MNFLLLSPDTLSLDMALTRCLPGGNPVKVLYPEESLTALEKGAGRGKTSLMFAIFYSLVPDLRTRAELTSHLQ